MVSFWFQFGLDSSGSFKLDGGTGELQEGPVSSIRFGLCLIHIYDKVIDYNMLSKDDLISRIQIGIDYNVSTSKKEIKTCRS